MAFEQVMSEFEAKKAMIDIGHRVWQKNWVAANDGNFSYRLNEKEVLCTPTGVSKDFLTMEHICKVDVDGKVLSKSGKYRPSSEVKMHLRVMRERDDVRSVIHAHPPYCTAHAIAGIPLAECVIPEIIVGLGSVPIAPYGTPSTPEIPDRLAPLLNDFDAWLLENHGALTAGPDIYTAYFRMESIELFAQMMYLAKGLGNVNRLSRENVQKLIELRPYYGLPDRNNVCKNCGACEGTPVSPQGAPAYGEPSFGNQAAACSTQQAGGNEAALIEEVTRRVKQALGQ